MDRPQHLRELNSVTTLPLLSLRWPMVIFGYFAFAGVMTSLAITVGSNLGTRTLIGFWMWTLFSAAVFLLLRRTNWFDCIWRTSPDGLIITGLFRRRIIKWEDVIQVSTKCPRLRKSCAYLIRTNKDATLLPNLKPEVSASVWMHLKAHKKAQDMELTQDARSFWMPIPNSIRQNLEWINPLPPRIPAVIASLILFSWVIYSVDQRMHIIRSPHHIIFDVAITLILTAPHNIFRIPLQMRLHNDSTEVKTLLGSYQLQWKDVKSLTWEQHRQLRTAVLCLSRMKKVKIPWDSERREPWDKEKPESIELILGIVRALRSTQNPIPVVMPETLRAAAEMMVTVDRLSGR